MSGGKISRFLFPLIKKLLSERGGERELY